MGGSDHFYFFECSSDRTVDVLTANNNDVNFVETQTVHFAWLLNRRFSSFRFEGINKVDRDFSH